MARGRPAGGALPGQLRAQMAGGFGRIEHDNALERDLCSGVMFALRPVTVPTRSRRRLQAIS